MQYRNAFVGRELPKGRKTKDVEGSPVCTLLQSHRDILVRRRVVGCFLGRRTALFFAALKSDAESMLKSFFTPHSAESISRGDIVSHELINC